MSVHVTARWTKLLQTLPHPSAAGNEAPGLRRTGFAVKLSTFFSRDRSTPDLRLASTDAPATRILLASMSPSFAANESAAAGVGPSAM